MPLTSGGIYYADNSTSASIADITAAMATSINNTIAPTWTAYVPSLTGATRSSGSLYYAVSGNVMHIVGEITVSAVSGQITVFMPSGWNINTTVAGLSPLGEVVFLDVGVTLFLGHARLASSTGFYLFTQGTSGTFNFELGTAATQPFTWSNGDKFAVNVTIPVTKV